MRGETREEEGFWCPRCKKDRKVSGRREYRTQYGMRYMCEECHRRAEAYRAEAVGGRREED